MYLYRGKASDAVSHEILVGKLRKPSLDHSTIRRAHGWAECDAPGPIIHGSTSRWDEASSGALAWAISFYTIPDVRHQPAPGHECDAHPQTASEGKTLETDEHFPYLSSHVSQTVNMDEEIQHSIRWNCFGTSLLRWTRRPVEIPSSPPERNRDPCLPCSRHPHSSTDAKRG